MLMLRVWIYLQTDNVLFTHVPTKSDGKCMPSVVLALFNGPCAVPPPSCEICAGVLCDLDGLMRGACR